MIIECISCNKKFSLNDALMPIVKIPKRITYLIGENMRIKAVYADLFGAKKHLESMIRELKTE